MAEVNIDYALSTVKDVKKQLSKVDTTSVSEQGRELYIQITEMLNKKEGEIEMHKRCSSLNLLFEKILNLFTKIEEDISNGEETSEEDIVDDAKYIEEIEKKLGEVNKDLPDTYKEVYKSYVEKFKFVKNSFTEAFPAYMENDLEVIYNKILSDCDTISESIEKNSYDPVAVEKQIAKMSKLLESKRFQSRDIKYNVLHNDCLNRIKEVKELYDSKNVHSSKFTATFNKQVETYTKMMEDISKLFDSQKGTKINYSFQEVGAKLAEIDKFVNGTFAYKLSTEQAEKIAEMQEEYSFLNRCFIEHQYAGCARQLKVLNTAQPIIKDEDIDIYIDAIQRVIPETNDKGLKALGEKLIQNRMNREDFNKFIDTLNSLMPADLRKELLVRKEEAIAKANAAKTSISPEEHDKRWGNGTNVKYVDDDAEKESKTYYIDFDAEKKAAEKAGKTEGGEEPATKPESELERLAPEPVSADSLKKKRAAKKSKAEPVAEPAAKPVSEPATEPATKPATKPVTEPAAETVSADSIKEKRAAKKSAKTEPVAEPESKQVEPIRPKGKIRKKSSKTATEHPTLDFPDESGKEPEQEPKQEPAKVEQGKLEFPGEEQPTVMSKEDKKAKYDHLTKTTASEIARYKESTDESEKEQIRQSLTSLRDEITEFKDTQKMSKQVITRCSALINKINAIIPADIKESIEALIDSNKELYEAMMGVGFYNPYKVIAKDEVEDIKDVKDLSDGGCDLAKQHQAYDSPATELKIENGVYKVYATKNFRTGDYVEVAPIICMSEDEIKDSPIEDILYEIEPDNGLYGLVLGNGSLYQHNEDCNMRYAYNEAKKQMIFIATKAISKGDELTINYGKSYWEKRTPDAFKNLKTTAEIDYVSNAQELLKMSNALQNAIQQTTYNNIANKSAI